MEPWMVVLGVAILLLPVVLMLAFHGGDRADARGRRVRRTWRARAPRPRAAGSAPADPAPEGPAPERERSPSP